MSKTEYPSMPLDQWPEPDRRLWEVAKRPFDPFDDGELSMDWQPATIEMVERYYGQYLSFLQSVDQLDPAGTPLDRICEAKVRSFIEAFGVGRAEKTVAIAIDSVADMARACHPPVGHAWLNTAARRMQRRARPARSIHGRSATIDELLWLGELLLRRGRQLIADGDRRKGAVAFRDGLIILTLTVDPVRRRNMAGLRMGKTFLIEGTRIRVHFPPLGTKTKRTHDCCYPEWLTADFFEYLETVRPILLKLAKELDEGWVWIGQNGTRMRGGTFRVVTASRTLKHLGRVVPPHNFRHSTMSDVARLEPHNIHITSDILDHTSFRTTERYYIMAKSFDAFAHYDEMIERRRSADR